MTPVIPLLFLLLLCVYTYEFPTGPGDDSPQLQSVFLPGRITEGTAEHSESFGRMEEEEEED